MLAESLSNLYFSNCNSLIINIRMLRQSIFMTNGNTLRTKTLYICNRKGADMFRNGRFDAEFYRRTDNGTLFAPIRVKKSSVRQTEDGFR